MKIGIIIQARMGSTRLPGKSMMKICGKPLIWHVIERMKHSKNANVIIVATTTSKKDNPIVNLCKKENVPCYRGNEEDVLDRYYCAAKEHNLDIIIRVTGDSPLNDPILVDEMIDIFKKGNYDYVANVKPPWMDGFDVEVFSFRILEESWKRADMKSQREHVTPYMRDSGKFRVFYRKNDPRFENLQCSVDRKEDLIFARRIYREMYKRGLDHKFTYRDVIQLLEEKPQLTDIVKGRLINEGYLKSLKEDKKVK
ncbi:MAG: glycosyltransferase family protein [Candidatus Micrarchaeia archaeon]